MSTTGKSPRELLEAQIALLKQNYVASFPQKKAAIISCWQRLNEAAFDTAVAAELSQLAHRLVGSGGLRGFNDITLVARQIETLVNELNAKEVISAEDSSRFDTLFEKLTQVMDGATENPIAMG